MEGFPERQGTEFDWFALDDAGEVAVFATAGLGPVPAQVRTASEAHDAMGDRIAVTGRGTPTVWDSYARGVCLRTPGTMRADATRVLGNPVGRSTRICQLHSLQWRYRAYSFRFGTARASHLMTLSFRMNAWPSRPSVSGHVLPFASDRFPVVH